MAHVSALGLVLLVYCSTLQQMDVEAKARATEEDRVNTTTCMHGTYDKKIFRDIVFNQARWSRRPLLVISTVVIEVFFSKLKVLARSWFAHQIKN